MSFVISHTVKSIIEQIDKRDLLLPSIQREFVWKTSQIENLFDSLMRNYPISSFLFWKIERDQIESYDFYEFVKDYNGEHNSKANPAGKQEVTAVIDGQQRLNSFYIGLKGSYLIKRKITKLYLNLRSKPKNSECDYDFKFLPDKDIKKDQQHFWFNVSKILNFKSPYEVQNYLIEVGLTKADIGEKDAEFASKSLHDLFDSIHKNQCINLFLEEEQDLDRVLNIFIRVNNGGSKLTHADLLLSMATAQWKGKDARETIQSLVDEIKKNDLGIEFTKDFVLKSCLVLSGSHDIAFKANNFSRESMHEIEDKWDNIADSIKIACSTITKFGYQFDSSNAVIPIAYYLYKINNPVNFPEADKYREDREKILKFLIITSLKGIFGGTPDPVIVTMRKIISEKYSDGFPLSSLREEFRGKIKSMHINDDDIEELLSSSNSRSRKKHRLVLGAIYPTLDWNCKFDVDHIFPKAVLSGGKIKDLGMSSEELQFYKDNVDTIPNLCLIKSTHNKEKSDQMPLDWLNKKSPEYKKNYIEDHYIPNNCSMELSDFKEFIEKRKNLIAIELKNKLSCL